MIKSKSGFCSNKKTEKGFDREMHVWKGEKRCNSRLSGEAGKSIGSDKRGVMLCNSQIQQAT
jgi:hypothetical protein